MGNNVYGIDLGTNNLKVFCKSNGKILKEKNTIFITSGAICGAKSKKVHERNPSS